MASVFSDELNYLIFRYLSENGFVHTAFAFSCESGVATSDIDYNNVPNGSLITIVQKGILYAHAEVQEFLADKGKSKDEIEGVKLSLIESVIPKNSVVDINQLKQDNNSNSTHQPNGGIDESTSNAMNSMMNGLNDYKNMQLPTTSGNLEDSVAMDTTNDSEKIKNKDRTERLNKLGLSGGRPKREIENRISQGNRDRSSPINKFNISSLTMGDSTSSTTEKDRKDANTENTLINMPNGITTSIHSLMSPSNGQLNPINNAIIHNRFINQNMPNYTNLKSPASISAPNPSYSSLSNISNGCVNIA
uniref:LisH domain-containing protein n=1 Tax=Parastrongyloides trichosuri TaxID=131310 RepID=A0A0N4ZKH4_PARTI